MEHKNRKISLIIKFISFIACFAIISINSINFEFIRGLENEIKFAGITSFLLFLLDCGLYFFENKKRIFIILNSYNIKNRYKKLRISCSYLIKIYDESYLLVLNRRKNQYQPVGGVYKYDQKGTSELFDKCKIERDTNTDVEKGEYDLRLYLHDRFKLENFLGWFDRDENRESDPWREFYEEIILTGVLDYKKFYYINYTKKYEFNTGIYKDSYRGGQDSLKIFTIYELNSSCKLGNEAIQLMRHSSSEILLWATADEILKGICIRNGNQLKIAKTARLLLNHKQDPRNT